MKDVYAEIARTCACFHMRRSAREVSVIFDKCLQPTQLRSTQFVSLLVIELREDATMSQVAKLMGMDRTTLTSLIGPLAKRRLVKVSPGADRRTRFLSLTPRGRALLSKAVPFWKMAQGKVVNLYSPPGWDRLLQDLSRTTELQ
jgi:DNA-binding MarR family transcriptional regulator